MNRFKRGMVGLLLCACPLLLTGCAEVLSALAASSLTGWLTNQDGCITQEQEIDGKKAITRVCTERSILPKGLRDFLVPAPAPVVPAPVPPPAGPTQARP